MFVNPYEKVIKKKGQWLRSNFHIHAGTGPDTCGAIAIDDVIAAYKEANYDVLTISNHDIFSDVQEYQKKHDIVLINGFEFSTHPHMLCIGNTSVIKGSHQEVIDECRKQGGFVILCHPNWMRKEYLPWSEAEALTGYTGIEIYNSVIFRMEGSGLATDTWDFLLSRGKLVWGFANDDFHRWHDMARSWTMIYAEKNQESVRRSIDRGSTYVSTGLILREFIFENGTIKVLVSAKDTYVKDYRYIFIGENGKILKDQTGEYGEYKMEGSELYVRVQVVSEHGAMLWTQPIYDSDRFTCCAK